MGEENLVATRGFQCNQGNTLRQRHRVIEKVFVLSLEVPGGSGVLKTSK